MGYLKNNKKNLCILAFPLSYNDATCWSTTLSLHIAGQHKKYNLRQIFAINQLKTNMPLRSKYVTVFGSQSSDSQSGLSQPEKTTVPNPTASLTERRRDRPLTKQVNIGLLKVKLPKFPKGKKQTDKSLRKQTIEAIAYASVCREEAAPNPHTGG